MPKVECESPDDIKAGSVGQSGVSEDDPKGRPCRNCGCWHLEKYMFEKLIQQFVHLYPSPPFEKH